MKHCYRMAQPVEAMTAEDLQKEREGRRNWLATVPANNAEQVFAKSMVESLFELRELAEDNLRANPAGAAPRSLTARRRLVELATRNANRMQVAARDGFQLAAKVFGGQPDSYMGLTADEMAAIRQARKETEAAKKREETAAAASTKQPARNYRPYTTQGWSSVAMPPMGQMMMPQQPTMQQAMAMGQSPLSVQAATPQMMTQMMPHMAGIRMPLGYVFRPPQDKF
jgi:hypothetical protein